MSCNKIKQRCTEKNYATCIEYELQLPEFTTITDDCYTLEETTEDTYTLIGDIKSEIDLSELGQGCLNYVQEEGKNIVKNVLLKYEEEICTLKQKVQDLENGTSICNTPITGCDFTLGTLVDDCDEPPTTYGELLQILINQHNS